jgi:hypothetical protein
MDFFVIPGVTKTILVWLFILKLVAAMAVGLVYAYYYSGGDFNTYFSDSSVLIQNFFKQGTQMSAAWTGNFEYAHLIYSSKLMIILNAVLQLFSFGNINVHFVFFCFFSFIGLTALLKAFVFHFPQKEHVIIALFLIPGVLFWGSAPLKESVSIGVAGLLVYLTDFGLKRKYSLLQILFTVGLILLLILIKVYVFLVLLPALMCNLIVSRGSNKLWIIKYACVLFFLSLIALVLSTINPDFNILKQISDKQAKAISEARGGIFLVNDKHFISLDYNKENTTLLLQQDSTVKIADGSDYLMWDLDNMSDTTFVTNSADTSRYKILYKIMPANSLLQLKKLNPSLKEFVAYSPVAFLNALIHPSFYEISSWLHLICALENLFVILLLLATILFFDKKVFDKKEIILFCLTFSIIIYVIVGITTPVIGTMVRHRTIAELFMAAACFLMIDWEKAKKALFGK